MINTVIPVSFLKIAHFITAAYQWPAQIPSLLHPGPLKIHPLTVQTFYQNDYWSGTNYTKFNYNAYNTNNISWTTYTNLNFSTNGTLEVVGPNDVTNFSGYNWQSSWFGNFYLPANSPLLRKGSTTANLLGLFAFTTQTNQIINGNNTVDIGYHYVATDSSGNPLDNNQDGIPDYQQDPGLLEITNGLTTWYLFSGNLIDSSLYKNDGTWNGTSGAFTTGQDGQPNHAAFFNATAVGSGFFISAPFDPFAPLNNTLTVTCWINPMTNAWSGLYTCLANDRHGGSLEAYLESTTGNYGFYNGSLYNSSFIPPTNTWSFVAFTLNSSGNLNIYTNGSLALTQSSVTGPSGPGSFQIGYYDDGMGGDFQQIYWGYAVILGYILMLLLLRKFRSFTLMEL